LSLLEPDPVPLIGAAALGASGLPHGNRRASGLRMEGEPQGDGIRRAHGLDRGIAATRPLRARATGAACVSAAPRIVDLALGAILLQVRDGRQSGGRFDSQSGHAKIGAVDRARRESDRRKDGLLFPGAVGETYRVDQVVGGAIEPGHGRTAALAGAHDERGRHHERGVASDLAHGPFGRGGHVARTVFVGPLVGWCHTTRALQIQRLRGGRGRIPRR